MRLFLSSITERNINSQQLMFPKELELSTKQLALFDDFEDNLKAMGFGLRDIIIK